MSGSRCILSVQITASRKPFDMALECYRQMIEIYGAGNVSTCGFSSGGALALGVAAHINAGWFFS